MLERFCLFSIYLIILSIASEGAAYINIEYEGQKYEPADAVRKATEYLRGLGVSG